jgi:hypothetical protein
MAAESPIKSGSPRKGDEVPLMSKCFICGASDKNRVYLHCIHEGEEKLVCARCLPVLIDGGH